MEQLIDLVTQIIILVGIPAALAYLRKTHGLTVSEAQERKLQSITLAAVSSAQRRATGQDDKRLHAQRLVKEGALDAGLDVPDDVLMVNLVETAVDILKAPRTVRTSDRTPSGKPPPIPG